MSQLAVFTYGTLMPGNSNAALIDSRATAVHDAVVDGIQLHVSPAVSYPFAVPTETGSIRGSVYRFAEALSAAILRDLDFLEGFRTDDVDRSLYLRVRREATLLDTATSVRTPVWVYVAGPRAPRLLPYGAVTWVPRERK